MLGLTTADSASACFRLVATGAVVLYVCPIDLCACVRSMLKCAIDACEKCAIDANVKSVLIISHPRRV